MYKLFPLIILIITQATSPTIASGNRSGGQIEVRNGSQTENRSGNQTEVRLPPPAHDNMGGWGGSRLLPYSVAATATAILIASTMAVVYAVRRRKKESPKGQSQEKISSEIQVSEGQSSERQSSSQGQSSGETGKREQQEYCPKTTSQVFEGIQEDNDSLQHIVPDEAFVKHLTEVVENNMSDSEFSIGDLAMEMAMSRTPFFKKVKEATGATPWQFIMTLRLGKAAELLSSSDNTISEICLKVGIKDPSNFTRLFKAEFGATPKEYRKESKIKKGERPL